MIGTSDGLHVCVRLLTHGTLAREFWYVLTFTLLRPLLLLRLRLHDHYYYYGDYDYDLRLRLRQGPCGFRARLHAIRTVVAQCQGRACT